MGVKKCAKKPKNAQKCAQIYMAGPKMNADRGLSEEFKVFGDRGKIYENTWLIS